MELDTTTLRVSFGVVALTMLVLFYFVSFRTSRSTYCAWWCVALGLFMSGSVAYLLDGSGMRFEMVPRQARAPMEERWAQALRS